MKKTFAFMEIAASMALGAAGTYMLMSKPNKPKRNVKSTKQS